VVGVRFDTAEVNVGVALADGKSKLGTEAGMELRKGLPWSP
jgi:hypothetical protein